MYFYPNILHVCTCKQCLYFIHINSQGSQASMLSLYQYTVLAKRFTSGAVYVTLAALRILHWKNIQPVADVNQIIVVTQNIGYTQKQNSNYLFHKSTSFVQNYLFATPPSCLKFKQLSPKQFRPRSTQLNCMTQKRKVQSITCIVRDRVNNFKIRIVNCMQCTQGELGYLSHVPK